MGKIATFDAMERMESATSALPKSELFIWLARRKIREEILDALRAGAITRDESVELLCMIKPPMRQRIVMALAELFSFRS